VTVRAITGNHPCVCHFNFVRDVLLILLNFRSPKETFVDEGQGLSVKIKCKNRKVYFLERIPFFTA
jgi:hypothetical protein